MFKKTDRMSRSMTLALIAFLLVSETVFSNPILDKLKSTPVSQYDFGFFKLSTKTKEWAAQLKHQNVGVLFSKNEEGGIDFFIMTPDVGANNEDKSTVLTRCKQLRQSFLSSVLANYGDPSSKNTRGENMYLWQWAQYFSSSDEKWEEREKIAKALSSGSIVTIYTGSSVLPDCKYRANESYKHEDP